MSRNTLNPKPETRNPKPSTLQLGNVTKHPPSTNGQVASVLLNPTPVDTLAQTTDNAGPLSLEMIYGGQV